MKILVDVSLSPGWLRIFERVGIEAQHWAFVGKVDAADRMIMNYAEQHGFAILTHDLDFGIMLFETGALGPSVIQLRSKDVHPDAIGSMVVSALREVEDKVEEGAVLTIDVNRIRLRLLPFRRPEWP